MKLMYEEGSDIQMDDEDELCIDQDDEPKTPPRSNKPQKSIGPQQQQPLQPNNILDNALSVNHTVEQVPSFLVLGRRMNSRTSDPSSNTLYAFARAWFLAHKKSDQPPPQQLIYHQNHPSSSSIHEVTSGNKHADDLYNLVQKQLIYASGTDMVEKMSVNRRKIQKKKTLLAELKKWAKLRKQAYLQFHSTRNQQIEQQIHERYLASVIADHQPTHHQQQQEPVDLLCDEESA